ncbi:MAG: CmcJ/NvfI family oxidoreductase, partial [Lysobacterales bacterium]
WRTINQPVESSPLTCCDARSIAATDLVASERRAKERIGELQLVSWNPAHRWYWFPKLQKDEAVLIKTFDSSTQVARRSIHSAFANSSAPKNASPRESIESRALLFF